MSEDNIIITEGKKSCIDKTKLKSFAWLKILTMPVEYPVSESSGKGWEDPCNCLCGTLCFLPKASILFLTTPYFCCFKEIE